jgi:hypothetical protein
MPKHLVTALGLVVSLGVIALGFFLVALPVYLQAVGVGSQTATVVDANASYEEQVDTLRAEEENLDAINAEVADLRSQIPAVAQLDDVFEVVGRAAETSGVALTAVTAGEHVAFAPRTSAVVDESAAPQPTAPDSDADVTDPATTSDVEEAVPTDGSPSNSANGTEALAAGRQQVDFIISATAGDMEQVTAFLDALRAGPRLLSSITATSSQAGGGAIDLRVTALTYLDVEG